MKPEELFEKRMLDLSHQAYSQGRYTFSPFLDMYEQSMLRSMANQLKEVPWTVFGGYPDAGRVMVRFGSFEEFSYEQDFPISLLGVKPEGEKFSRKLSHRDYLGALMNLGIERNLIGDILVKEQQAYVFVKDAIGPFLMQEWKCAGRLAVTVRPVPLADFHYEPKFEEMRGFVPSFRADVLVGFLCKTSRKESSDLIKAQKVFINGAMAGSGSTVLKEGDVLSVRGYGKAIFSEVGGQSKKGRYAILMKKYI